MDEKIAKLDELKQLFEYSDDEEFKVLIKEEIKNLEESIIPQSPEDTKDAIVEIRAGTGGEEAELFAAELARMYMMFAEKNGLKAGINSKNESSLGGIKEIIFDAYWAEI